MPKYNFLAITTAQAAVYDAAEDELDFTAVEGARATNIEVVGQYTLLIVSTGARANLGPNAQGEVITLPDGSVLSLPSLSAVAVAGGAVADHLYGGDRDDLLQGLAGDDRIEARGGADTLDGGTGTDTLTGGAGADVFVFAPGDSGAAVSRADTITDWTVAERLLFSTPMAGGYVETTANPVTATALANQLIAAGTADVVAVHTGFEVIIFADTRNDDGAADDIILLPGATLDDISAANILGLGGLARQGLEGGPGDDGLLGTSNGDLMTGLGGADSLDGAGGDDTLEGGPGDDMLTGGDGDDLLVGGEGVDRVSYFGGPPGVNVDLATGNAVGVGFDRLVGIEDVDGTPLADLIQGDAGGNRLRGFAGADSLAGRAGADTLDGGDGDDVVAGGPGADQLRGGRGADIFLFQAGDGSAAAPDEVLDFTGGDRVQFGDVTGLYTEITAADYEAAREWANAAIAGGVRFVAARVGDSVYLFGDTAGDGGVAEDAVRLIGATLAGVSSFNVVGATSTVVAPPQPGPVMGTAGPDTLSQAVNARLNGLDGDDLLIGGEQADTLSGGAGADSLVSAGGNDNVSGGDGPDTLVDTGGANYLRGDAGDDRITGGDDFDDINGNTGNDTASGGAGADWVVGGKDNDLLFGDAGNDLVYGNLGSDTCEGGAGADTVRGGQDNDVVRGGDGDDFLSGDRGDDTMTGGAGADLFSTFAETGIDRVTDFNAAQGDRVMVAPGTVYTVVQSGADTVIEMFGGGQMILVGVQASSLPNGWIFGA